MLDITFFILCYPSAYLYCIGQKCLYKYPFLGHKLYLQSALMLTHESQHFMEGHAKSAPISRLPLITILDTKHHLRDIPVCQVTELIIFFDLRLPDLASDYVGFIDSLFIWS